MLKETFNGTLTAVKKISKTIFLLNFVSFRGQGRSSHEINNWLTKKISFWKGMSYNSFLRLFKFKAAKYTRRGPKLSYIQILSNLEIKGGHHMRLITGRLNKSVLRVHELPQFVVIIQVQGCQIYNNLPTGFKRNKRKPCASIKDHFSVTDRFSRLRDNVQGSLPWGSLPTGFKRNKRKPWGSIKDNFSVDDRLLRLLCLRCQSPLLVTFVIILFDSLFVMLFYCVF